MAASGHESNGGRGRLLYLRDCFNTFRGWLLARTGAGTSPGSRTRCAPNRARSPSSSCLACAAHPPSRNVSKRSLRRHAALAALLLGLCAAAPLNRPARADGLHCNVLDGEDLEDAWNRLVAETWPGAKEAPRVSVLRDKPRVVIAIKEMIYVLQFVDPYNYADDSPAWMSTEASRTRTRQQAEKLLASLGRGSAPYLWEALEAEYRFIDSKDMPDKFVKPFREIQAKLKGLVEQLGGLRRQDPEYAKAAEEQEKLRTAVNTLKYLKREDERLARVKIAARSRPELAVGLDELIARTKKRIAELGDLDALAAKKKELEATIKARLEALDADEKAAGVKAEIEKLRKELGEARDRCLGLGQGDVDISGGDPEMMTTEDFKDQLIGILRDMGPEAYPSVARGKSSLFKGLREMVAKLEGIWKQPDYAKRFVAAAASDKTPVGLGALRFLKANAKEPSVTGAMIESLKDLPEDQRKPVFELLRAATKQVLGDDPAAWIAWWAEQNPAAPPKSGDVLPPGVEEKTSAPAAKTGKESIEIEE